MDAHSYWSGIIIAETTYVIATLSPGPALLSTIGTSMGAGRRAGIALGLGIVAGSFCWAVMAALGVSLLIAANGRFLSIIALVGSVYLAFLGYKGFRSAIAMRSFIPSSTEVRRNLFGHFLRGWGIYLTNPKAVLAWMAIMALGLRPGDPKWVLATILAGTMASGIFLYTLCAVAFSTTRIARIYGKSSRWIDAAFGLFFIIAAVKLALQ